MSTPDALRIDRLLWMLRLTRSRSAAQGLVARGHVRMNGKRVERVSQPVCVGDVLTVPLPGGVRILAIEALPERRGSAPVAASHYREIGRAEIADNRSGIGAMLDDAKRGP